jgi:steroid delta-isomerase-like uncharacterized protein
MTQLRHILKMVALSAVCIIVLGGARYFVFDDMAKDALLAWNSHDPDKIAALFADDAVHEDATLGTVNRGGAEIRKFAKQFFDEFPDCKFTVTSSFMENGHGYAEWVLTGTDIGMFKTNKHFNVRGASIVLGSSKKLTHQTDYWDMATLMRQIGVLPTQSAQSPSSSH